MNMEKDKEASRVTAIERVEKYKHENSTNRESVKNNQHPSTEEEADLNIRTTRKRPLLAEKDQDIKRNDTELGHVGG